MAFSYFCEFFSRKTRGPFVIVVASFWTVGQVFAAVVAMPILDSEYLRQNVKSSFGMLSCLATITNVWCVFFVL